jgi:hypothetical protein
MIIEEYFASVESDGWATSCTNSAYGFSHAQDGKLPCLEISDVIICGLNSYAGNSRFMPGLLS